MSTEHTAEENMSQSADGIGGTGKYRLLQVGDVETYSCGKECNMHTFAFYYMVLQPNAGYDLLIHEVS
jgi:hypothetical protein